MLRVWMHHARLRGEVGGEASGAIHARSRATLSAPTLPTILLTRSIAGRLIVERCCTQAEASGVRVGMPLADARALAGAGTKRQKPVLLIRAHKPDRDATILRRLARWALRYAPVIHIDEPDGLLIDLTGTQRVHASEWEVVRRVAGGLARAGIAARVAVASTPGVAWALAHTGPLPQEVVEPGRTREAIAGLPLRALRLEAGVIARLDRIGVRRCGDLFALPRSQVAARFGMEVITRMDQALGLASEPLHAVRPPAAVGVQRRFESPTPQPEAIAMATAEMVEELIGLLAGRGRGVREMRLTLVRAHARREQIDVRLSRPSVSVRHVLSLVRTRLEKIDVSMGGPGVERMSLTARRTGPVRHEQAVLDARRGAQVHQQANAAEAIDTLAARLGVQRVLIASLRPSHLPERASELVPMLGEERLTTETQRHRAERVVETGGREGCLVGSMPRPTSLFAVPEPAEVVFLSPDGPVARISWRGETHEAVWSRGPERIADEWWMSAPDARRSTRDYMMVQTGSGRVLWLCHAQVPDGRSEIGRAHV